MKVTITRALVWVLTALAIAIKAEATSVTTTKHNGKTYTVDVTTSGTSATIYFRVKPNACSAGDLYIGKFALSTKTVKKGQTIKQAAATLCTVKNVIDDAKTAVGCATSLGSVVCLMGSVPEGGITAVLCSGMIEHTLDSGLMDCVKGVADKIASHLAGDKNWKKFALAYNINYGSLTSAINAGIDLACTYSK